jgi:hypothetical protein
VDNFSIGFEEEEQNFKPPGKLLRRFTFDFGKKRHINKKIEFNYFPCNMQRKA